jgi:hypothetical protein
LIKKIITALAALLLMAAFYVLAVIANPARENDTTQWLVTEDAGAITAIGLTQSDSQQELADLFGAAVPRLPDGGQGQVNDASYRGIPARLYSYHTGSVTLLAVRPLDAAPLLLASGYALSPQSVPLLGTQASLAVSGASRRLYFAGDDAAYALTADGLSEADFLTAAGGLTY